MTEGRYSVSEIDLMRNLVVYLTRATDRNANDHKIEDRLRTYMLNGTTVEELRAAAYEAEDEEIRRDLRKVKAARGDVVAYSINSRGERISA